MTGITEEQLEVALRKQSLSHTRAYAVVFNALLTDPALKKAVLSKLENITEAEQANDPDMCGVIHDLMAALTQ